MNKPKPAIVFDFGGVLVDWDPHYLYRQFFDGDDAAIARFMKEIGFTDGICIKMTGARLLRAWPY